MSATSHFCAEWIWDEYSLLLGKISCPSTQFPIEKEHGNMIPLFHCMSFFHLNGNEDPRSCHCTLLFWAWWELIMCFENFVVEYLFMDSLCANQLTVSTLGCWRVNRKIKFDCEKSSLTFPNRLGKVVDQQLS